MTEEKKHFNFQTEVQKVLDILIFSLYTHKEIFLRELISNASDALEKINYKLLTEEQDKIADSDQALKIWIKIDEGKKKLTISDSGIGMDYEEMKENLGTIAHSDTYEFLSKMGDKKDLQNDLIGQFGVGFYSVFMVAKEVHVHSRVWTGDGRAFVWISDGKEGFELKESTIQEKRGTTIEIYLKDDDEEYLKKHRIEEIIKKYSNFVNFPIYLEDEQINRISALWAKNKSDITKEQYHEFYRFISKHQDDPAGYLHLKFDVPFQFSALLFVPKSNLEKLGLYKYDQGISLYCRRILIMPDNKELLPNYLRFMYGVVDSEDLNLNVSRETIQNNPVFQKIKTNITSKVLDYFVNLSNNQKDEYKEIYSEFCRFFKEGIQSDFINKDKLVSLLRFKSSKTADDDLISLKEYTERMKEDQKEIYYLLWQDINTIENSPYIEIFMKEDTEVLYLDDPLDEFVLSSLMEFEGKKFKSIEQQDIDLLKDKDKKESKGEEKSDESSDFLKYAKEVLTDKVIDVIVSKRLVDSPACLVNTQNMPSSYIQNLMKMMNQEIGGKEKILEINPDNEIVKNLIALHKNNPGSGLLKQIINQVYDNASIISDRMVQKPEVMVKRLEEILKRTTDLMIRLNEQSK